MSFLRPEIGAHALRFREVGAAFALSAAGVWLMSLGGWVLWPVGLATVFGGAAWAAVAIRRLRFARPVEAPGVVTLDEGQLGYFGPVYGGIVALADIVELRLGYREGALEWRLRARDGGMLRVPADALGSERLYDAFAVLPGIDMALLTRALAAAPNQRAPVVLWVRPGLARPPELAPPPAKTPGGGSRRHHDLS